MNQSATLELTGREITLAKKITLTIDSTAPKIRIDLFLAKQPELGLSRARIQSLLAQGLIKVNGKTVKPSYQLRTNDCIDIIIPEPEPLTIESEQIPLDIYYEDEQVIVINKPAGMVVHPAAGVKKGTLVNALLAHCKGLSGIGGIQRPGIVHRLDKGTSGLLMVAKTDFAHQILSAQLKERSITRKYLALVYGKVEPNEGYIETKIGRHPKNRKKMAVVTQGGRIAGTYYNVIQYFYSGFTLVECKLTTGRTHQIRVHLSYVGHPIVGDTTYGSKKTRKLPANLESAVKQLNGIALHAQTLGFNHPITKTYLEFTAPLPQKFQELISLLSN
ncbi:MAG: RluA family pseudouridine synthase [bacterium]|nr:RluA family pseudouridine synthase [bacterium]